MLNCNEEIAAPVQHDNVVISYPEVITTNNGITEDIASGWMLKAIEDLKNQGSKLITLIPWDVLKY